MKTAKIKLKLMALLVSMAIFSSCDKDTSLDLYEMTSSIAPSSLEGEVSGQLSKSSALELSIQSEVQVQFSDDQRVVLLVTGTGMDSHGNTVIMNESRIIDLINRKMEGEGRIKIEDKGNIYFNSSSIAFPLPYEESSMNYSYSIQVTHTDIIEWNAAKGLAYYVQKEGGNMHSERTTINE